jgi:hypothetical protein
MSKTKFLFAAVMMAWLLPPAGAQTLEHRPAARPASPAAQDRAKPPQPPAEPVLPKGTSLQVEITRHYPMKAHEAIEGRLLHPLFVDGKLAVPENTLVQGSVVALEPDKKARLHARLRGDFTPFHTPEVQFDELKLPGGEASLSASPAADGAPVIHLVAAGTKAPLSLFARYWTQTKNQIHDQAAFFTAPGLGDRALQMLYHQLPYHPERIEAHTMWSFELTAPLVLPDPPGMELEAASAPKAAAGNAEKNANPETWNVNAQLTADLSSATAKPGDAVEAMVVEPVYDKGGSLVIPEGSELTGKVTTAKAARSLGRNGKLRFTFQQVKFPEGTGRPVQGSLGGATTANREGLSLDAEGTITPRNRSSALAPIALTLLAGRALDQDGNFTAHATVASNGFGLVGRAVGIAAGSPNLAAGIGYYAAGLSVYENFLRPGRDVVFPKDTRIEIETTPLRAPVLTPQSAALTPTQSSRAASK